MRNNLIQARKNKGLTQTELADKLGIGARQYGRLEAGTSNGSIENWLTLKKLLNVESIDYLLEQEVDTLQQQNTMKSDRPQ